MNYENDPFSAPKGYNLRTNKNVPPGEMGCLREVPAFTMSSWKKSDVIVEPLENKTEKYKPGNGFPPINFGPKSYQATYDPCFPGKYKLMARHSNSISAGEVILQNLYYKGKKIK